jgi:hypothetical protein
MTSRYAVDRAANPVPVPPDGLGAADARIDPRRVDGRECTIGKHIF